MAKTREQELAEIDDRALLAWARIKAMTGLPEQQFTDNDRDMFMLGFGACLVEIAKEREAG